MLVEENKVIVKRVAEEISKGNTDALREIYAPNYVHHLKGGEKSFDDLYANKDKRQITIDDIMADGERVAVWYTRKKEDGDTSQSCVIFRFAGDKISESWNMTSIQKPD